jgi:hypothetical protein
VADRSLARRALFVLLLPHELAHWIVFRPWGRVRVIPAGPDEAPGEVALARLSGEFATDVPVTVVRPGAIAPTLLFPLVALALDLTVGLSAASPLALAGAFLLALWAAPSTGDVTVFLRAREVRTAGSFDVRGATPRGASLLASLLTVAVTAGVALLLV